jgi:pyruvate dehydrogenase E2 component (dihydrolipoyllysine-residue acetyltransferase)
MPKIVRLPEVLTGMSEAVLSSWHVSPGDRVQAGQPLAEVETDKAVVEYEAEEPGVLAGFLVEAGQSITAGTPIAVLASAGESIEDAMSAAGVPATGTVPAPVAGPEDDPAALGTAALGTDGAAPAGQLEVPAAGGRSFASPLVRRLARERGLDLSRIQGSGPGHRIVRRDLDRLDRGPARDPMAMPATLTLPAGAPSPDMPAFPVPAGPPTATAGHAPVASLAGEAGFTDLPHSGMRRAIARRLTESKSTVPHFYLAADCQVDDLLELRRAVNEQAQVKITLNDFVVKAVAGTFGDVPQANAIWTPDAIRQFSSVSIAVAVAVDGGLVTPVVRNADQRSLSDVSRAIADLADRARRGRLRQPELEGGSFAVSNLGMYGIERFTAIINPPQAGILAVGTATRQPVVAGDGSLGVATVMTVTLSGDHRIWDGALAAQWLGALKKRLEHPLSILI